MKIDGSTILLTGASSGIGEALAPMLAERGATLALAARRADRLEATLDRCRGQAPASRSWSVDLSDLDAAAGLVAEVWAAYDGFDVLINNAAVGMRKPLIDQTPEDVELVMRTNFLSPVRMAQAALPLMIERGGGAIVNVGSGGGRFGIVHESSYCAAKHALSGWTETAAMDLFDLPIEMKLIQPGAVQTEIWDERPGEVTGLPAEFVSSEVCAAGIVEVLEVDGVEFFVPGDLKAHVDTRNADPGGWVELMAAMGRSKVDSARPA